jgi:hypothetical protein
MQRISHQPEPQRRGDHKADFFQTNAAALRPLIPMLDRLQDARERKLTVWEPAAGHGRLSDGLSEAGYRVLDTDIVYAGKDRRDFLVWEPPDDWDCLVTNPPFSIKTQWIRRCYELGRPFALLLPYSGLERHDHQDLFREYGIDIVVFKSRPEFRTPYGKLGGGWFGCAWYTHRFPLPAAGLWSRLVFTGVSVLPSKSSQHNR